MRRLIIATAAVSMLLPATAFAQAVGGLLSSDSNNPTVQVSAPGTYSSPHQLLAIELSPVVTVQSEATADPGESFQPSGGVTYSYTVAGAPNVFVPVSILYNLQTSAGGYSSGAYAYLSTTLYSADGTLLPDADSYVIACSSVSTYASCSNVTDWTGLSSVSGGILSGYVPSNTPINIGVGSEAAVQGGPVQSSWASGLVDPQITILDPNFTLILPQGVGNLTGLGSIAGSLPEPSTWALMLLGFGAIGAAMRRTRKSDRLPQLA